ncbi:MarR family winged helix-turn-helix transcriptional regulator [Nesterenkonia suensis]
MASAQETARTRRANDAWEALLGAHSALMKQLTATDVWDELSIKEYDVLYSLSKCETPQRLSELHQHVLLSQPALSRLVDRLVLRGLLARRPDPEDRRATRLSLTDEGRKVQRRVGRRHAADVASAMRARLDRHEIAQLERLCHKLSERTHP